MEESAKMKIFRHKPNLLGYAGSNVFAASDVFPYPWVAQADSVSKTEKTSLA
jgi:hypothetical protein